MKQIVMITLILLSLALAGIVSAGTPNQDGTCIVPPDEYFVKDAPYLNGQPVHEGIQNGYTFWLPLNERYNAGRYLDMLPFTTKVSHNDQTKIAMGKMWYCDSLPDFPYDPELKQTIGVHSADKTGVSTDPNVRDYSVQHGLRFT